MSFIVPHLALIINAGINHNFVRYYLKIIQAYRRTHSKLNSWKSVVVSESGSDEKITTSSCLFWKECLQMETKKILLSKNQAKLNENLNARVHKIANIEKPYYIKNWRSSFHDVDRVNNEQLAEKGNFLKFSSFCAFSPFKQNFASNHNHIWYNWGNIFSISWNVSRED